MLLRDVVLIAHLETADSILSPETPRGDIVRASKRDSARARAALI